MNQSIKVRSFVLDDENPNLNLSEAERTEIFQKGLGIIIELIEIIAVDPNDLMLVSSTEHGPGRKEEIPFYFYQYRGSLGFQNNKYFIHPQGLYEFESIKTTTHFNIESKSQNRQKYSIKFYYSITPRQQSML